MPKGHTIFVADVLKISQRFCRFCNIQSHHLMNLIQLNAENDVNNGHQSGTIRGYPDSDGNGSGYGNNPQSSVEEGGHLGGLRFSSCAAEAFLAQCILNWNFFTGMANVQANLPLAKVKEN
ncbi:hypothetical protein Nepgr_010817 [Nepenthes gracilis]|uniref:Uncharacterized protein n=1 Tax=Nepenthes gracilis TaxID=150966 RepID=A0AAD3SDB5_NEPGR|nr:hypothetical protein Nepgr_010817 [Nepenthes gracilis]